MIRFCCGVALAALMPASWVGWWPLFGTLALLGLIARVCLKQYFYFLSLAPLLLGLSYGCLYASWGLSHLLPIELEGQDLGVSGYVVGLPEMQIGRCRFQLEVDRVTPVDAELDVITELRKLQLSRYQCTSLPDTGEYLSLVVRLKQPRSFVNQGGFDFERLWFSQQIDARGYVRASEHQVAASSTKISAYSVDRFRRATSNLIDSSIAPGPARAIIKAITLGDRRELSNAQWQVFRQTGTIHLLVISGLHIGLVSGFVWLLMVTLLRVAPSTPLSTRRALAVIVAIVIAACYALMAGFTLPTQRALVMTALVLFSWLHRGQYALSERLLLALVLVLLLDPLSFLSAGFWLSFGATAMLLYLIKTQQRQSNGFYQLVRFQLGMSLFSIPLLSYHFYQVPLTSLLFNLIAVPLVSFVLLPLTLMAVLLLAAAGNENLLALLVHAWDFFYLALVWMAENLSVEYLLGQPSMAVVFLAVVGVLWLLSPRVLPGRLLAVVLLLPLVWPRTEYPPPGAFTLDVVDVGQGLSVLVRTQNHALLYDTGAGFASGFSIAELTLVPMLKSSGIKQLDLLLISHRDNDHAGGENTVVNEFKPQKRIGTQQGQGSCIATKEWQWDEVYFELLHPDSEEQKSENNRSCVLKVSSSAGSALLTGDIEASVEMQLLNRRAESLDVDILLVPHHGSRSSSTDGFIQTVSPSIAINSAGYRNPYGHPHPEIVARYNTHNVDFYNTAETGQIHVELTPGRTIEVFEYRKESTAYWRR